MNNNNKGISQFESYSSSLLRKVIALLAEIKQTRNGSILYDHIVLTLDELDLSHARIEYAYANFVDLLLEACNNQLAEESPLRTHIKLIQTRLTPPISLIELNTLIQCVEMATNEVTASSEFNADDMATALAPILEKFVQPALDKTICDILTTDEAIIDKALSDKDRPENTSPEQRMFEQDSHGLDTDDKNASEIEASASSDKKIDNNGEDIEQFQQQFIGKMRAAIAQSEEFGVQLNIEIEALHDAKNIHDVEARRLSVLASLEKLSEDHRKLAEKFNKAQDFLFVLESDHQQMSDELNRVRMLSLTDELTSLPNRRAFMRRLEDEVSRVQRYGYPLTLVLLDIDYFKSINDKYGHAGGDAVLKIYADEVLSMFRHHDMVARYGGEEFAVLLPNTGLRGVMRAFNKIRQRIEGLTCNVSAQTISVPTFSAGLAEYRAGETPSHLIERADSALYRAKHLGRNRIEVQAKEAYDDGSDVDIESEAVTEIDPI